MQNKRQKFKWFAEYLPQGPSILNVMLWKEGLMTIEEIRSTKLKYKNDDGHLTIVINDGFQTIKVFNKNIKILTKNF